MEVFYEIYYKIYNNYPDDYDIIIIKTFKNKLEVIEKIYQLYMTNILNNFKFTKKFNENFKIIENYKLHNYDNKIRKGISISNEKYFSEENILQDFNRNVYEKEIKNFKFTLKINIKLQEKFIEFLNNLKKLQEEYNNFYISNRNSNEYYSDFYKNYLK